MNIDDSQVQLTLDLDAGLAQRYRSVKEVLAAGIYRNGLKRTAMDLDVAPGNLSVMLSGDGQRHFDVDLMERYIETTGDLAPIYYLVAKHCGDRSAARDEALDRMQETVAEMAKLMASMGQSKRKGRTA